jgi:hypothetical protein
MAEHPWDEKLLDFVKKTGEDLKRTGEELLGEAQRTLDELRAPESQEKLRARVSELQRWAKTKFVEARTRAEEALGIERPKPPSVRSSPTAKKAPGRRSSGSASKRKTAARGKKPLGRRKR